MTPQDALAAALVASPADWPRTRDRDLTAQPVVDRILAALEAAGWRLVPADDGDDLPSFVRESDTAPYKPPAPSGLREALEMAYRHGYEDGATEQRDDYEAAAAHNAAAYIRFNPQARAALAAPATEPAHVTEYGHCGSLDWTVEKWGRVTHKHACPNRTDPWCQTHPNGCVVHRAAAAQSPEPEE